MYDSTIFNRYINEIGDPKIQEIAVRAIFHFIAKSRLYSSRFDFA